MSRLNRIWQCNTISFTSKFKLYKSRVTSFLLYGCKTGPCLLTLQKGFRLSKSNAWGNFSAPPTWSTRPMTGCRARSTPLLVHRNLFWQLSRDRNLRGLGMSHATTASTKPSVRAPWRVGDTKVSRGNAGWKASKTEHPCPCQNCSQGSPAEKSGRGSLLNHPSCPPNNPISQRTEMNWLNINT